MRVLIKKDGPWWVARCLEHDIAVQARDLDLLQYELGRVLTTQAVLDVKNDRIPFQSVPPAPADIEQRWAAGIVAVLESPRFSSDQPLPRIHLDARVVS